MLIITGRGRCGTTPVAKFFRGVGFDPGGHCYDDLGGGYEHREVFCLNYSLLPEREDPEVYKIENRVIKNNHFFIKPVVIDFWHRHRDDLSFLVIHRDPEEIYMSNLKWQKFNKFLIPKPQFIREYWQMMNDFIQIVLEHKIPFVILNWPHISPLELCDAAMFLDRIDIDFERAEDIWNNILSNKPKPKMGNIV